MKSLGDVVAELPKDDDGNDVPDDIGMIRRGSLDSIISRASTNTTSSSILSGGTDLGNKTLKSLKRGLGKLWRRHRGNASITEYDPSYKVAYLGNVLTGWAKGEGCVEKPVSTLWRNYVGSNRPDVSMRLTVTNGGLTATTKDHGLTEYWAHRVTYCTAPASHPRLFVWVYRDEGRRLRPELRCHAALCSKESTARRLASVLNARLHQALLEFRRDKVSRQNARLSLANAVYENPSLPRRKLLLSTGGSNYRPPLERSKSAPKLSAIEEDAVAEEIEQQRFLDELRSLEREAHNWHEQEDGWRLARLLDALHRESSDENGSISSGCETASTANSEERAGEDSHLANEQEILNGQQTNGKALTVAMTAASSISTTHSLGDGPRRNSEGSPHFMTCTGSPRFRRRSSRPTRSRSRRVVLVAHQQSSNDNGSVSSLSRSEGEESMEEEEEDEDDETTVVVDVNYYDFEDVEDMDEIVDYRPHGESPRNSCSGNDSYAALLARREDMRKLMRVSRDELDGDESPLTSHCPDHVVVVGGHEAATNAKNFHTLGSLDEEEAADSDESGYVEAASPKGGCSSQRQEDAAATTRTTELETSANERAEFIKCPISETIKKLANASLRSSKPMRMMPAAGTCLDDGESPSLLQRKRLLAQHGVTV